MPEPDVHVIRHVDLLSVVLHPDESGQLRAYSEVRDLDTDRTHLAPGGLVEVLERRGETPDD